MHTADRAVDGVYNLIGTQSPYCTNTNDGPGGPNWWMVDLQITIRVGHVVLTNRADSNCSECKIYLFIYSFIHFIDAHVITIITLNN